MEDIFHMDFDMSYNPNVIEEVISDFSQTPEYWLGHISGGSNASPVYTDYSGRGSKCKIEIISKTDLLSISIESSMGRRRSHLFGL